MRVTWQFLVLGIVAAVIAVTLILQRQVNSELRGLITLVREQNEELRPLQAERTRLVNTQIAPAELESLRAERAEIARLRGEIERARARLAERERAGR